MKRPRPEDADLAFGHLGLDSPWGRFQVHLMPMPDGSLTLFLGASEPDFPPIGAVNWNGTTVSLSNPALAHAPRPQVGPSHRRHA